jgi:hypothetical protein
MHSQSFLRVKLCQGLQGVGILENRAQTTRHRGFLDTFWFSQHIPRQTVLVKKSDRLLFVSFWFARQSVSGLFLLPASTVGASFG